MAQSQQKNLRAKAGKTAPAPSCRLAPRGLKRRQAMLKAASELFLEKGFDETSLSDIVQRSRGSRSTLYKYFENKEGLLRAIVEDTAEEIWQELAAKEISPKANREEWLTELGIQFVKACLSPKAVALFRILVADGGRVTDATARCFDTGPKTMKQLFSDRLAPFFPDDDIKERKRKASIFLGCVMGDLHLRMSLGLISRLNKSEVEQQVKAAVKIFLHGVDGC